MIASFVLTPVVLVGLYVKKVLRPGALGKHGLRIVDAHAWWVWLLCGFMVFYCGLVAGFLVALVPAIAGPGPATDSAEPPLRYTAVMQVTVYAASLGGAAVILRLLRRSSSMGPATCVQCGYSLVGLTGEKCPECGTTEPRQMRSGAAQAGLIVTGKSLGLGVLCLLITLPVVNTVSILGVAAQQWFSGKEIPTNLAHPVLKSLSDNPHSPWVWIVAGIAVLIAPIQEEIVFRGFLQTSILRLTGRPWVSILIAGAVFGAVHLLGGRVPWYAVVSVFVLGLAMGLAFEKTRSLGTSIAMHVGFNAVNVAIAILGG